MNEYTITCPHCRAENEQLEDKFHEDNEDYDGNRKILTCKSCNEEFITTLNVEVSYTTTKK